MIGETRCQQRRCIIVGSALGVELPKQKPGDLIIAANGGAAVARDTGRKVDVLVTTSHLFAATNRTDRTTLDMLKDLNVESMWVDTKNGSLTQMRVHAMAHNVEAKEYVDVNPFLRDKITTEAVGTSMWVSTGIWAACLAVVSRASHVQLCGISMRNGHRGMVWDSAPRFHLKEDRECLRLLGPMGVEMPTELMESVI